MITVFGQPELSGDFLVDGVGNIQMPIVGAIAVAKSTIDACRRSIEARLADGVLRKPGVSVRVGELRPIFVLGDVRAAGSYPFRFGLSPLSALALAGGVGSGEIRSSETEVAGAEERVATLIATRQALQVRRARLQAEQAGSRSFEIPEALERERDALVEAMVWQERDQLAFAIDSFESQVHLLRQQRPRIEAEIAALKEQLQAEAKQLQLTSARLKDYDKLSQQGLGRASSTLDLQRQQALDEANMHRLRAELSRLDVTAGDLEIRIQDAEIGRRQRIMSTLAETHNRLREVELSLAAAQDLLALRRNHAGRLADERDLEQTHQIWVMRDIDGRLQALDPSAARMLEPGDVVEIRRLRSTAGGRVSSACEMLGAGSSCPHRRAGIGSEPDMRRLWPFEVTRTNDEVALAGGGRDRRVIESPAAGERASRPNAESEWPRQEVRPGTVEKVPTLTAERLPEFRREPLFRQERDRPPHISELIFGERRRARRDIATTDFLRCHSRANAGLCQESRSARVTGVDEGVLASFEHHLPALDMVAVHQRR